MNSSNVLIFTGVLAFVGLIGQAQEEETPKRLADLKFRYEVEVARTLDPIQRNYIKALDQLLRSYTEAGDLEAVMKTREEIARARMWVTLPIETMRQRNLSKMTQDEFRIWLRSKHFAFTAKTGPTTMTFDEDQASWKRGDRTFRGSYTLTSNRQLTIKINESNGFTVVFEEDLQAGTLESALGKYDLKISDRK